MRLINQARLLTTTIRLLYSQWWSREKIAVYQETQLLRIMRYAVEQVPFYAALGIASPGIRSIEDLQRFPIVTKADLQERGELFFSGEFPREALHHSRSSGMTGEPTVTGFDDASWLLSKYALKARRVLATTRSIRQRILIASEQHTGPALPKFTRLFVDVKVISLATDIQQNLATLARFAPTVLYGFPSYLVALVDAAADTGIGLPQIPLIYTSSEVLTIPARTALERAFRGRVVDVYGSTEFKEIAVQCQYGRHHINCESVYVESVQDGEGEVSRLLVTTLQNRGMPLIRYELGDTGRVEHFACACGRASPQLVELHGRLAEMLVFPDGTRLSQYLLTTAIEQEVSVKHFRIVHEQPWAIRVETLARPALTDATRDRMHAALAKLLPAQVAVRFVELGDRGERSKRRAVSREL